MGPCEPLIVRPDHGPKRTAAGAAPSLAMPAIRRAIPPAVMPGDRYKLPNPFYLIESWIECRAWVLQVGCASMNYSFFIHTLASHLLDQRR